MSASSGTGPILNGKMQSDLDANNFAIVNLDLAATGIVSPPTIQHTTGVLKGDGNGNAELATPKTHYWDTTVFPGNDTAHGIGLVPDPGSGTGTANFLCEDGSWQIPPGTAIVPTITGPGLLKDNIADPGNAIPAVAKTDYWDTTLVAGGGSHTKGLVPDPGAGGGTTKYLREDGTWDVPPAASGVTLPSTLLVIKGDNAGGGAAATPGTSTGDYVQPSVALGRLLAATTTLTSTAGNCAIDWRLTEVFKIGLTENTTFSFTNTSDSWAIVVHVTNTALNRSVTWTNVDEWVGGGQPSQTGGVVTDVWGFQKVGSIIRGFVVANMS